MNNKITLNEDTLEQEAQKNLDVSDDLVVDNAGDIEIALDEALEAALYAQEVGAKDFPNVLFTGKAGTGKTSRITAWAKRNNINLLKKQASSLDDSDIGGALAANLEKNVAIKLTTDDFKSLDNPRSVLFLDELNRGARTVRGTLLTLIQDHVIPDNSQKEGVRFLPNFLFTVAAINPATADYNTDELDDAEMGRFREVEVQSTKKQYVNYLENQLKTELQTYLNGNAPQEKKEQRELIVERQIAITKKLFADKLFNFDNNLDIEKSKNQGNGKLFINRTYSNLIRGTDGTKDQLIRKWNQYCNSTKLPLVKQILANYEDIDDKATRLLKDTDTSSEVFGQDNSVLGKLRRVKF